MSERTRFFGEQAQQANAAIEQRRRDKQQKQNEALAFDAKCCAAAALYEPHFKKLEEELLRDEEGVRISRTTTTSATTPITAIDAYTNEKFEGNVYLSLAWRAGDHEYELVYLVVPTGLGMLAWRKNDGSYYVGQQSKASPAQLVATTLGHHVNVALDAMTQP